MGLAAPGSAYSGGCYVDANGNCNFAPFSLATGDGSPADRAAFGTTPDQHFAYLVTHDDNAPEFRIMDFPSLKGQALWTCQLETNGISDIDSTHMLENAGGYAFDQANAITSSANTIYCTWNLHLPPADVTTAPPRSSFHRATATVIEHASAHRPHGSWHSCGGCLGGHESASDGVAASRRRER